MKNKNNTNVKYLLCLYSNIALLNTITYAKINKKNEKDIKENNIKDHFELNDSWKSLLNKINKKINKEKDNRNEKIDEKNLKESIPKYVILLRNFYSHSNNNKYNESKNKLELFEEQNKNEFNKIIRGMNMDLFKGFSTDEKRTLFVCLFLNKSEIQDLVLQIKAHESYEEQMKNVLTIIEKSRWYRKYAFLQIYVHSRDSIYDSLLSYIKNFKEVEIKKNAFIKMAISLLNYIYKNDNIKFEKLKGNEKYFINFKISKNPDHFEECKINFEGLKILLLLKNKEDLKKLLYSITIIDYQEDKIEKKNHSLKDKYASFKGRYSINSKINNRHLLKTLNKVNSKLLNNDSYQLHQHWFELLFQTLSLEEIELLKDEILKERLVEMLKLNKNNLSVDQLREAIKKYILDKVNSLDNFKKLVSKKSLGFYGKIKGTKYIHWRLLKNQIKKLNLSLGEYYEKIFNFENLKNPKNQFDKNKLQKINSKRIFLAPIITFFINHFNNVEKPIDFDDAFCNKQKIDQNIFNNKQLKLIFDKKIHSNKNEIKIINKKTNEEFKIVNFKPTDMHIIINSKLFFEFKKLLKIDKINEMSWKKILNEIHEYRKREIEVMKMALNWDADNKHKDKNKYRNYVFHRSLSQFKDHEEFLKVTS